MIHPPYSLQTTESETIRFALGFQKGISNGAKGETSGSGFESVEPQLNKGSKDPPIRSETGSAAEKGIRGMVCCLRVRRKYPFRSISPSTNPP